MIHNSFIQLIVAKDITLLEKRHPGTHCWLGMGAETQFTNEGPQQDRHHLLQINKTPQ